MNKHTPRPWTYGVRADGSIWLSLGSHDGTTEHWQGDFFGNEDDARLITKAPELLASLSEAIAHIRAIAVLSVHEWGCATRCGSIFACDCNGPKLTASARTWVDKIE